MPGDGIRRLFRLPPRRAVAAANEMDEEIQHHIELRAAQLIAKGWSREAALAEANRRFGDRGMQESLRKAAVRRERVLAIRGALDMLVGDVVYALRRLRQAPAFTSTIVATFALGIGANATMFGVIDRLLLRPPERIAHPEDVYSVRAIVRDGTTSFIRTSASYSTYRALKGVRSFSEVAGQTYPSPIAVGRGASARAVPGVLVTGGFFQTLGVRAQLGRMIGPSDDDDRDAANVVVISDGLWRRDFGADAAAIGRTLDIGTGRFTIIGVAPRDFVGVDFDPVDIWIPINAPAAPAFANRLWRQNHAMRLIRLRVRLAPGTSTHAAEAQANAMFRADEMEALAAETSSTLSLESIVPSRASEFSQTVRIAIILAGVSTLVFLIASANVANLLLTLALRRRREIALRIALGVSRVRLATQFVTESLVLAMIGGCAGVVVIAVAGRVIRSQLLPGVAWSESVIDMRTLMFTAAATTVIGLIAALVPAIRKMPLDLTRELRFGTSGAPRSGVRTGLLVVQATLSVILLAGTGLFIRSFQRISNVPLGLDVDRLLVARVNLDAVGYSTSAANAAWNDLAIRARAIPGVERAVLADGFPLTAYFGTRVAVPGRDTIPELAHTDTRLVAVSPDYFVAAGTPLVQGRDFSDRAPRGPRVAVVNERLANSLWPRHNAVGQCIKVGWGKLECAEVVGVVPTGRSLDPAHPDATPQVYIPIDLGPDLPAARALLIRTSARDAELSVGLVRQTLQTSVPNLPYVDVRPLRALVAAEVAPSRLGAILFGAFGVLALVLSAIGLYGTTSYVVGQRMQEMGIRLALGATSKGILGLVVGRAVAVAALGSAIGLTLALLLGRLVASLLFDTSARDPLVLFGVVVTILAVSALAALSPAVRATRADPLASLRSD